MHDARKAFASTGGGFSAFVAAALLALPFLAGVIITGGLSRPYHTFHWTDEQVYHYPAVLQFERELPRPDLSRYPSATTPLYHLLLAVLARTLRLDLVGLRFVCRRPCKAA